MRKLQEMLKREMESPARTEDGRRIFDGILLGLHLPLNPNRHVDAKADLREMAERCYGYGNWRAPYWFIGLGEGIGPNETVEDRAKAWSELEQDGLCDCRDFHRQIGEKRWHEKPDSLHKKPVFEPTWRRLMLLLMAFLEKDANDDSLLRKYQSEDWGMRQGETCVCELFGLPAPNFKAYEALMKDRFSTEESKDILQGRIEFFRKKILCHNPTFVVMYGRGAREQWKAIAGCPLPDDTICRAGDTMMVSAVHPTAHGVEDAYWVRLGRELRLSRND